MHGSRRWVALCLAAALALAGTARANGPRWVTGPPYFTGQLGVPVIWYTRMPAYFTDPGDLSSYVSHAQADAIVAAAAGVWKVETADIDLHYGGALNEHVSGANSYLSSSGIVFPADVTSANYQAKQIAVIYDSTGAITDMLLGSGASSPVECPQYGVTESVDSISPAGFIQHAVVILNGRCTGPAPEQQLQLQYQLQRVFGRVLGMGWSQTNDNVFTRTPTPTIDQALHWPIMHPIDIVCGPYTYQCLPQPFTLRDDDIAGITALYLTGYSIMLGWTGYGTPVPGSGQSYDDAGHVFGALNFPTAKGMAGVNVLAQRRHMFWAVPEAWYDSSSVSGFLFQQNAGNPVAGTGTGIAGSMGSPAAWLEGFYDLAWIPMIDSTQQWVDVIITTEPVNPLYTGVHAVGPYGSGGVTPSGSPLQVISPGVEPNDAGFYQQNVGLTATDAPTSCTGGGGTETAPVSAPASGWWTGQLCVTGQTSWVDIPTRAGRTAALEVTALDEAGLATTQKMMPQLGVWGASDATGKLPTIASTPSSFNTIAVGTTAAAVPATSAGGLRVAIADARGAGRPDFAYQARLLYADTVQPAVTSTSGGLITVQGMGFRPGNSVTVGGMPVAVSNWTASTITGVLPPASAFRTAPVGALDVTVRDLQTGGITVVPAAITYGNVAPDQMLLVSAPSGTVAVGSVAPTSFAVRMVLGDGVTPVAGLPVTFTASGAAVQFASCTALPCVVVTDATGLASVAVTPTAFGAATLTAAALGATQTATFNAIAESLTMLQTTEYVAAGATVAWSPQAALTLNGTAPVGTVVSWTGAPGMTVTPASSLVSASGIAQASASIGPLPGLTTAAGHACAWASGPGLPLCTGFSAVGVDPAAWRLTVVSGAGQTIALAAKFAPVVVMVTDGAGHPVAGAPVAIHQSVDELEMPCPVRGRCPVAPVLGGSEQSAVSDVNGLVTVTPMQLAGVGEVTNIALAAGTQGFCSLSIEQSP